MPYTPQTWNDNDTTTPLSGARMAYIEAGIQTAQATAEHVMGYGANWVAASDAPSIVKQAVVTAGGAIATGTNDHAVINTALSSYKSVCLTEGRFTFGGSVALASQKSVFGQGMGTKVTGASGLAFPFFTIAADNVRLSSLWIDGTNTSTSAHGVDANITSSSGFLYGADGHLVLEHLALSNTGGDGLRLQGTYDTAPRVIACRVYAAAGRAFYLNTSDGYMMGCGAANGSTHGIYFEATSSNWRVTNTKSANNAGDGFSVNGNRHQLTAVEAQDNGLAGFRLVCNLSSLNGFTADSNSWATANLNTNISSGVEVGRNSDGTYTNGFDIALTGGQAWDRNAAGRGRAQRSGIRVRTGATGLAIAGVTTGDPAGTHYNVTKGIEFDTGSDATAASNSIYAVNHNVAIKSI